MTAWEIVLWLLIILVGAACLASLLVLVALYRGLRDERDEMEQRRRMAVAMGRPLRAVKPHEDVDVAVSAIAADPDFRAAYRQAMTDIGETS